MANAHVYKYDPIEKKTKFVGMRKRGPNEINFEVGIPNLQLGSVDKPPEQALLTEIANACAANAQAKKESSPLNSTP